jgi:hypothetical protein
MASTEDEQIRFNMKLTVSTSKRVLLVDIRVPVTDVFSRTKDNHLAHGTHARSSSSSDPMMLIFNPLIVFALTIPSVFAQDPHNLTTIVGTWSSGSQAVVTGAVSFIIHLTYSERVFNNSVCLRRTSPILKT